MIVQTPAARSTDPNASHEAAAHIDRSGIRARQQHMAAKAVALYPGMTSLEIAEHAHLCRYMLARRLPECETAGQVRRGQERRCAVSGRLAGTWYPPGSVVQMDMFNRERMA